MTADDLRAELRSWLGRHWTEKRRRALDLTQQQLAERIAYYERKLGPREPDSAPPQS